MELTHVEAQNPETIIEELRQRFPHGMTFTQIAAAARELEFSFRMRMADGSMVTYQQAGIAEDKDKYGGMFDLIGRYRKHKKYD